MVRAVLIVLILTATAFPCLAGVGEFGVYSDAGGNNCILADYGGGALVTTYVVHHFYSGDQATGSRFGIDLSGGATWQFLQFQSSFPGIPSVQGDISIGYGSCVDTSTNVGSALWLSLVAAPACTIVSLKPADGMPTIVATDCEFNEHAPAFANFMVVNPDGSCMCAWATRPTTWGSIKALYR